LQKVRYGAFGTLVNDLRDQALTSTLADAGPPLARTAYHTALSAFETLRENDGKVSETFEIISLTAWND